MNKCRPGSYNVKQVEAIRQVLSTTSHHVVLQSVSGGQQTGQLPEDDRARSVMSVRPCGAERYAERVVTELEALTARALLAARDRDRDRATLLISVLH